MDKLYYKEYYRLEREHWWFRARLKILEQITKDLKIQIKSELKILNAGAATGATSIMLKKYGDVLSLEYDQDCAKFLSKVLDENILNDSLTDLPLESQTFDIVCAFDVIEHIEAHEDAIRESNRVLKNGGYLFITVPAFEILWSKHDDINHHYRRYRIKELKKLLIGNGFKIEYHTYFNFFLFLPIFIIRFFSKIFPEKKISEGTGSDFESLNYSFLNKLLYWIFLSESFLMKHKFRFPFGVSAMIIAKKQNEYS